MRKYPDKNSVDLIPNKTVEDQGDISICSDGFEYKNKKNSDFIRNTAQLNTYKKENPNPLL